MGHFTSNNQTLLKILNGKTKSRKNYFEYFFNFLHGEKINEENIITHK